MSLVVSEIVKDIKIPRMAILRQFLPNEHLEKGDIPPLILDQLSLDAYSQRIKPGMRIAITAGSRGVANIALIIKTIVDFVKEKGAYPFIVPAMGSHGGATAAGQVKILNGYGITEEYLGCPICSSMDVKLIGITKEGYKVYCDRIAAEADGIIVTCRIKPHTAFSGPIESGIMKMLTIGLGNHLGAATCHEIGYKHFSYLIPLFGRIIMDNTSVLFAVAAIENAYDETYKISAVLPEEVEAVEPLLLKEAKEMMPRLLYNDYDVLIVDKIGKDISGAGMDPYITGAFCTPYAGGVKRPQNIAVLDLTDETNGNSIGIGQADVTTKRLWNKTNLMEGYPNGIVSRMLSTCKMPMILDSDKEAIQVCIFCSMDIDKEHPRIIRIQDTLHIEKIMVSEALLNQAVGDPGLSAESDLFELEFDEKGNLW